MSLIQLIGVLHQKSALSCRDSANTKSCYVQKQCSGIYTKNLRRCNILTVLTCLNTYTIFNTYNCIHVANVWCFYVILKHIVPLLNANQNTFLTDYLISVYLLTKIWEVPTFYWHLNATLGRWRWRWLFIRCYELSYTQGNDKYQNIRHTFHKPLLRCLYNHFYTCLI